MLFSAAILASACKSSESAPPVDAGADDSAVDDRPPTPPEWDRPVTRPDDTTAATSRASCTYVRGALPAETLGASTPVDADIPIQNVVVLMQENRSFDSYYGHLAKYAKRTDIESAPEDSSNPDTKGVKQPWHHAPHLCFLDTAHGWDAVHTQINGGAMDGFFTTNDAPGTEADAAAPADENGSGTRAMSWYDERDLPFYYDLASTFTIADHYHASVPGPTWPNRMFLYGATSYGWTHNELPDLSAYPFPDRDAVLFDELEKRHVDWAIYTDGPPGPGVALGIALVSRWGRNPVHRWAEFLAQAQAGTLPAVAIVDAKAPTEASGSGQDEHPPGDVQVGQKFASDLVHAMFQSPQWAHSAIFLTYDEHGGIYDHVVPPKTCTPDPTGATLTGGGTPADFASLGVRVPLTVVSPYAKRAYVAHAVYDHASITRFIETKCRIPALSSRDANADPLFDAFDFANPPFVVPPVIAEPTIEPSELAHCQAAFGP